SNETICKRLPPWPRTPSNSSMSCPTACACCPNGSATPYRRNTRSAIRSARTNGGGRQSSCVGHGSAPSILVPPLSRSSPSTARHKCAVSRAVARLLQSGLLSLTADAGDRRRALLRLSPAGQAIHDEVVPHARGFEERLLDGMPEAERTLLFGLLDRLDELELRAEAAAVG